MKTNDLSDHENRQASQDKETDMTAVRASPQQFADQMKVDAVRFGKLIRERGIKVE